MKKSSKLELIILTSIASAFLTDCTKKEYQHCVDKNNVIVEEQVCKDEQVKKSTIPGYVPAFLWMYHRSAYRPGQTLVGGHSNPTPGSSVRSSSHTSRGGFGSSSRGSGVHS